MNKLFSCLLGLSLLFACTNEQKEKVETTTETVKEKIQAPLIPTYDESTAVGKSQTLLTQVKMGENTDELQAQLASLDQDKLATELDTDNKRLAFWVNIYNAYIPIVLGQQPSLYDDRGEFFEKDQVKIAGDMLSFDKIEHGLIRSSTMKLSLGYVGKLFPGKYEKQLRVEEKDPRIHFVVNCGAKDCPPVYVYSPTTLDKEFDKVAAKYLRKVTTFDKETNTIKTTPLFKWFIGDFGGKDGVVDMLVKYQAVPTAIDDPEVEYIDYDWTLDIDNFGDQDFIAAK